ncbi:MAG: hypothetical protein KY456_16385, partial [Chloroflexi bacterium]|nr:hypothetical protein [Chloroflexota bacterium]
NRSTRDVGVDLLTSLLVTPGGDEPFKGVGTVTAGTTLQIFFGTDPSGESPYSNELIFNDSSQEGVRITFNTGAVLTTCCDGTTSCLGQGAQVAGPGTESTRVRTPSNRNQDRDKRKSKKRR